MSKRNLVLDAFNNKKTERVPVGFWFHFVEGSEFEEGVERAEVVQKNISGHRKFFQEFQPDFLKLMSDGFFSYPNKKLINPVHAKDLTEIESIGEHHPWIEKQVELVKALTDEFGTEVVSFYNIFAPATFFKLLQSGDGDQVLARLIQEDADAVRFALNVIAEDLAVLSKRLITEGGADGIYLSVQNVQDERVDGEQYKSVVEPSDRIVLEAANEASEYNILHICGYEGSRNDLSLYRDYPAKIFNWAVTVEGVSLQEGKQLFGGKAVIGGFNNTEKGILYSGTKNQVQEYTHTLLEETGRTGVILGADCTVPADIEISRLEWVREAAGK